MADDPLLEAALIDRARLVAELEADPRFKRLQLVEQVIETLGGASGGRPPLPFSPPAVQQQPQVGKTEMIANAVETFLRINPGWHTASEIYDHLTARGIEVGGKNPKSNLTAHMSSAGRFVSDRAKGWRLKHEQDVDDEAGGEDSESRGETSSDAYEASRPDIFQ